MKILKKQTAHKKKVFALSTVALVAIISYGVFAKQQLLWPFGSNQSKGMSETRAQGGVNYSPPTEQEVRDSQNGKKDTSNNDQNPEEGSKSDGTKKSVSVMVNAGIYNNKLEVRAFTPQIIEGSGTCTALISNGSKNLPLVSAPAFIDASSSICEPMYINASLLTEGSWYVIVSYSSPNAEGSSGRVKIQ